MQALSDLKYSLRLLRKTPVFTAITIIVIVLGLTLYLTSYTVARMISDQPMPFPAGERYIVIKTVDRISNIEFSNNNHDMYIYNQIKRNAESYSLLGAYASNSSILSDGDYARQYPGAFISTDLLAATVTPLLGRRFAVDDAIPGAEKVVIISYAIWQEYYGGDPDILGKVSRIDGLPTTIIGRLALLPLWTTRTSAPSTTSVNTRASLSS